MDRFTASPDCGILPKLVKSGPIPGKPPPKPPLKPPNPPPGNPATLVAL